MIHVLIAHIEQWQWCKRYQRRLGQGRQRATVTEMPHYDAAELAALEVPAILTRRQGTLTQEQLDRYGQAVACEHCPAAGGGCVVCRGEAAL
jgi:hypothetical protein